MTKESVLDDIAALLEEYYSQYGKPLAYKAINQKWNKVATRVGFDLLPALKADSRFIVDMDVNAAHRVTLGSRMVINKAVMICIKQAGRAINKATLRRKLLSFGYTTEAISEVIVYMESIGVIQIDGDVVTLADGIA